jgi:hypothetical protein
LGSSTYPSLLVFDGARRGRLQKSENGRPSTGRILFQILFPERVPVESILRELVDVELEPLERFIL